MGDESFSEARICPDVDRVSRVRDRLLMNTRICQGYMSRYLTTALDVGEEFLIWILI